LPALRIAGAIGRVKRCQCPSISPPSQFPTCALSTIGRILDPRGTWRGPEPENANGAPYVAGMRTTKGLRARLAAGARLKWVVGQPMP
jgi:hypothetical protein